MQREWKIFRFWDGKQYQLRVAGPALSPQEEHVKVQEKMTLTEQIMRLDGVAAYNRGELSPSDLERVARNRDHWHRRALELEFEIKTLKEKHGL